MPIYEFYCEQCHTIYNFFSRKINLEKIPDCPKCRDANSNKVRSCLPPFPIAAVAAVAWS